MVEWSQFIIGLLTAAFLWLLLPSFAHFQPYQPTPWFRWFADLPPIVQLLANGLLAGCCTAIVSTLFRVLQKQPITIAPLLYALGWFIGTAVVGGWQLHRGRFPFRRRQE